MTPAVIIKEASNRRCRAHEHDYDASWKTDIILLKQNESNKAFISYISVSNPNLITNRIKFYSEPLVLAVCHSLPYETFVHLLF